MEITQERIYKLAKNTKMLRVLNRKFKDDFKKAWGCKYDVICDYTHKVRIYFNLKALGDSVELPLFIDGVSEKDDFLFDSVDSKNLKEAKNYLLYLKHLERKHEKRLKDYRPSVEELKTAFIAEERAERKKNL